MDPQAVPKNQLVDRLKSANNILVTVRTNPSVDLLAACLGLTLVLDKLNKHAAAVFSGEVPSTIEFLKPEQTLETNTDSLRDFIIALDKSKADKLRYKVEDKLVRIFITPYRTSLSQDDLIFEQGDFNVDAVVALGAHKQEELDEAITSHGRILHDATVMSINNTSDGNLGSINWQDIGASSVSELVVQLVNELGKDLIDQQVATALLTGIVSETARFSNEKTTPQTMELAGQLMTAGANQQLVATELESAPQLPVATGMAPISLKSGATDAKKSPAPEEKKPADGTLEIDHKQERRDEEKKPQEAKPAPPVPSEPSLPAPKQPTPAPPKHTGRDILPMPDESRLASVASAPVDHDHAFTKSYAEEEDTADAGPRLVDVPNLPTTQLSPVRPAEPRTPAPTAMPSVPSATPQPVAPTANPLPSSVTAAASAPEPAGQTLEAIETSVASPHVAVTPPEDLDKARSAVLEALQQGPQPLHPLEAIGAAPMGGELHPAAGAPDGDHIPGVNVDAEGNLQQLPQLTHEAAPNPESPANQPMNMILPPPSAAAHGVQISPLGPTPSPSAPPPGPPPMMPPNFMNPGQ